MAAVVAEFDYFSDSELAATPLDVATAAAIQPTLAYLEARVKQANAALEAAGTSDVAPMEGIQKLYLPRSKPTNTSRIFCSATCSA